MSLYVLLSVITAIVLLWVYVKWVSVKNFWKKRGVPFLPPNPILGSLTFLQRRNPAIWLLQLYKLKSPYVGIWFLWRPGLVINSPEIARRILVKDFDTFRNRYLRSGKTDPIGGLNLFTVNDPLWSSVRHRISSVFTAAKLRVLQDFTLSKSKELIQRIQNEMNNPIDLKVTYVDYTTDVIGTSAFGVASNSTLTGKGTLREIAHELGTFSLFRALSWCSIFFFPDVVDFFRFKYFPTSSTNYFKKIIQNVANEREKNNSKTECRDLLDALLKMKKESKADQEEYSDDLIVAQAVIFLFGGFETSGSMLSFITYELAYCPEIQEKLFDELQEAKQRNGNNDLNSQQLAELTYLNCIIKEGLRKYSPMGWLDRIAVADYKIDDKLSITAGTPVYVNIVGMHYDPEYFPEPYNFNPDRFLQEYEKDIKPYTYMPFGEGPRFCIGKRFAMMTIRYALASVFLKYRVQAVPNRPKPNDIKIHTRCLLYLAGEPLLVNFISRT